MLLKDYVFWDRGVPSHVCDQIVKYGTGQPFVHAGIGDNFNKTHINKDIRDSDIGWLQATWILDWIKEPALRANRDIFKYNLNRLELIQFTKYTTGQHYDWHIDMDEETSDQSRKLSMIVSLTDPSEYTGGEVEFQSFRSSPEGDRKIPPITKSNFKGKGTILLFPSHIWHRVKPITKGIRYSLVGWWSGPLFT